MGFLIAELRPFLVFIAVLVVGYLERNGLANESSRSENVALLVDGFSWAATIISGLAVVWIERHKHKSHPVVSDGDITVEVTQKRRFSLQPILTWFRNHKIVEIEKKSEGVASTAE